MTGTRFSRIALTALLSLSVIAPASRADCVLTGRPIGGTVSKGGYSFDFESQAGVACHVYRLRNKPGQPMTPVRWSDDDGVLMEWNLAACSRTETECSWKKIVKTSLLTDQKPTEIGYGINRDQYKQRELAVVEGQGLSRRAAVNTYGPIAEMKGTVAGDSGGLVSFDLTMSPFSKSKSGAYAFGVALKGDDVIATKKPLRMIWGTKHETYVTGAFDKQLIAGRTFEMRNIDCTKKDTYLTIYQENRLIASMKASPCVKVKDQP